MSNSQIYRLLPLFGIFISCNSETQNAPELLLETQEIDTVKLQESKIPSLEISNETDLKVELLLEAKGEEFYSPDGIYYYAIGDFPITMIETNQTQFLLKEWNLVVESDTIIFEKTKIGRKEIASKPVASINLQFNKYQVGLTHNGALGKINLSENGNSCDDSYSGQFNLISDNKSLTIKGLANIDIFENNSGSEIFVLSYHNCVTPDLRIYRISK